MLSEQILDCEIFELCSTILDAVPPHRVNPLQFIIQMPKQFMFHIDQEYSSVAGKPSELKEKVKSLRQAVDGISEPCPSIAVLKLYLKAGRAAYLKAGGAANTKLRSLGVMNQYSSSVARKYSSSVARKWTDTGIFLKDESDFRLPALCKEFADVCACLTCVAARRWGFNCSGEVFVIRQTKPWVLYAASKRKRPKDEGIQTDNYAMTKQTKWTHWFNALRLEGRFQFFDSSMYITHIKRPEHFTNLDVADIKLTPPFTSSDGNWINPNYNPKPTESCLGSPRCWHSWKIKEHEEVTITDPS